MKIQYIQPEANQTELSRKVRGARLECERLELQLEANLRRIIGQVDCRRCKHASESCEHTLPSECPRFEPKSKPSVVLIALALLLGGCGIAAPEIDSTDAGDGAQTVVPVELLAYDCFASPPSEMGDSPDESATFQIWLDGAQLYTCHGDQTPRCPAHGGSPWTYDCSTNDLVAQ
jgi:hypothetical protein